MEEPLKRFRRLLLNKPQDVCAKIEMQFYGFGNTQGDALCKAYNCLAGFCENENVHSYYITDEHYYSSPDAKWNYAIKAELVGGENLLKLNGGYGYSG